MSRNKQKFTNFAESNIFNYLDIQFLVILELEIPFIV